jgi:hypothetical protein
MTDYEAQTAALAVSSVVSIVVLLGFCVWYGYALSRLFPRLGIPGWKGWVPFLGEAMLLERGGVSGWSVAFYVIPVVQLYGIYLRALALHRVTEQFGKGAGYTVLGIVFPPLWATLLRGLRMPAPGEYDRRVDALLAPEVIEPDEDAPSFSFPTFERSPEPAPTPVAAPTPRPTPAPEAPQPAPVYYRWAREPDLEATEIRSAHDSDDELDSTVVVERVSPVRWQLVTDDGHILPLRSPRVLLGRKPSGEGLALVVVPDSTKTLSKNHARLDLADGVWTVTDLDSTNGVIIVEDDGTETLLPEGGSAPVAGGFVLGKVGLRIEVAT